MNFTIKQAKGNFFDTEKILKAIGKARAKVGNRQGATIRKIMRQSMRRRKGPSPAGQPPNAHQGGIKDKTYYAWDSKTQSVVVGPVKLGKGNAPDSPVVNHIKPHRGDERLFWDMANLETVTKAVHDSEIQSEERGFGI